MPTEAGDPSFPAWPPLPLPTHSDLLLGISLLRTFKGLYQPLSVVLISSSPVQVSAMIEVTGVHTVTKFRRCKIPGLSE
jgi:hypothetical protein